MKSKEWMADTKAMLENMLFNEENADLLFVWEDGTYIPAHTNIVFRKCPYFK